MQAGIRRVLSVTVLIVLLGTDRGIMGKRTSGWVSRSLTWTATAVMSVAAVALLTTLIRR